MSNINQRLNGLDVFAYMGTNAAQPTDFRTQSFDPTPNDSKNFYLGTWWLNTTTLALWYLAALDGGIATWLRVTLNGASFFEGNSGGIVSPDNTGLLHIIGDGITVDVVGNPGTNTLTISAMNVGTVTTLTGNTGGAISPTAGNINVVGDGTTITIAGNPGTSTLTASTTGAVATSYPTNSGTAIPALGVLNVFGGNGMTTSGAGNTVTVTSTATFPTDSGTATPTSGGALTIHGGTGITTSGAGSTVTITNTGTNPASSCAFSAYLNTSHDGYFAQGTIKIVLFDTKLFDIGTNYNTGTNLFTAPANGYYFFTATLGIANVPNNLTESSLFFIQGSGATYDGFLCNPYAVQSTSPAGPVSTSMGISTFAYMALGDTMAVNFFINGTVGGAADAVGAADVGGTFRNYFQGWRVF
jgi:hypothetical protein